ncbi:YjdJ family protein [Metabacillus malikii]|uniref:DUF4306 domain-containing protein n=1 Tax=Metabacillus malikii TaxID=1504265 RepID=A0ABT9ZLH5_9BACI|nr:YjdJ family protein [Metabacillus malikii]MDQ0232642.1 hypothetical protein [Metabacillus malikii]
MIRFIIQFSVVSIFLLFSTVFAWYEGSAILDNPWEWKYSTPFTQLLYGVVSNKNDISQLDYFVYAAKFQPTFPIIMVLCCLYLVILIGFYILKQKNYWFAYYLYFLSGVLFLFYYFTLHSPTIGGHLLASIFLICGISCGLTSLLVHLKLIRNSKLPN